MTDLRTHVLNGVPIEVFDMRHNERGAPYLVRRANIWFRLNPTGPKTDAPNLLGVPCEGILNNYAMALDERQSTMDHLEYKGTMVLKDSTAPGGCSTERGLCPKKHAPGRPGGMRPPETEKASAERTARHFTGQKAAVCPAGPFAEQKAAVRPVGEAVPFTLKIITGVHYAPYDTFGRVELYTTLSKYIRAGGAEQSFTPPKSLYDKPFYFSEQTSGCSALVFEQTDESGTTRYFRLKK